ncbi:hypothetical protein [Olleya sp. HaHaR_3_96]|uniref:hypothetical protein n=1 Tax=Olleya sp. HaHaR_3_96 TaxID=2745560 RepID=UPI001C4EE77C|nr:hypothetical protein [Olleya sp. HaHaR_3_96]QXP61650.1 hypothetical protein H0I26_08475 [Olleya sp. HaHaR_3_96]
MNQEELRKEYLRLINLETIKDSFDLMDIYLNYFFLVIRKQKKLTESVALSEAKIVNQMIFTKIAHMKEMAKGIEYLANDGATLNKIIDPTLIASNTRNLYETISMFNLIYIKPDTEDGKKILYNLWVIAGLKYRQRFENVITKDENREKFEKEKEEIKSLINEIENTKLYSNLNPKEQKKIKQKIREKDYKIKIENNKVTPLSWQASSTEMGFKMDSLNNIYTYFSLYSHPSNVSVFQFADMFNKGNESFINATNFNLNTFFIFLSVFVADYIKLFPEVLEIYENLPQIDQIIINSNNRLVRGSEYSINNEYKALG